MKLLSTALLGIALFSFGLQQLNAGEPVSLFDGKTLAGWTDGNGGEPGKGWVAEDGVLHQEGKAGSIYSKKEYGDFRFSFEWKVAEGSNSGVKYRVNKYGGSLLGLEYQILDSKDKITKNTTASLYDIFAPNGQVEVKPLGEWNSSVIVAKGTKYEHWLNGKLVLTVDASSDEYEQARLKSKFKKLDDFGKRPTGRIMLQDHGKPVWFRNLTIEELE